MKCLYLVSCVLVYNQDLREDMVKTFPEAHVVRRAPADITHEYLYFHMHSASKEINMYICTICNWYLLDTHV